MADSILGGDFTVYYEADNRQKRVVWSGTSGTYTVNQLYSALQDLFDDLPQMDDGVPMSAQTPTEYTIGIIDAGDDDPWFIPYSTVEHLTGGAIRTADWRRVTGTNTGIVRVSYTDDAVALSESDIGETITLTGDGDTGTILDVNTALGYIWIRPTNALAANDWDGTGDCTVSNSSADPVITANSNVTGELLWANIYSIGTIASDTTLYINQSGSALTEYTSSNRWWDSGQIDILVQVREPSASTYQEIDYGYITVLARRYGAAYDYFSVDLTAGGRNPIPLATSEDLDNTTGYYQVTASDGTSGSFEIGDIIVDVSESRATSTKVGVITLADAPRFEYYLIDSLNNFAVDDRVYNVTQPGEFLALVPSSSGPANLGTPPVITHASTVSDVDEDGTNELYSITIDANQNSMANMWEWLKYITARGETGTTNTDGTPAQFYIGNELQVTVTTPSGSDIPEGDTAYLIDTAGPTTIAFGTVVANHAANEYGNYLTLSNYKLFGTLSTTDEVWDNEDAQGANYYTYSTARVVTPTKQSPFGTFAGGVFFGAPGVLVLDYQTAEENSFQLVDDTGTTNAHPTKVTATVTNTRLGDSVAVFRLTAQGGIINKSEYTCAGGENSGSITVTVGSAIASDVPGKSTGGVLRIVDVTSQSEYRIPFDSWTGTTFTLNAQSGAFAETGTTGSVVYSSGSFSTASIGDLLRFGQKVDTNMTYSFGVTYITSISDGSTASIFPEVSGATAGDGFQLNELPIALTSNETLYVPIIDTYETAGTDASPGSEAVNLTYLATIYARIRVRHAGGASVEGILPFETDASITSAGLNVATIRTDDSIYS